MGGAQGLGQQGLGRLFQPVDDSGEKPPALLGAGQVGPAGERREPDLTRIPKSNQSVD